MRIWCFIYERRWFKRASNNSTNSAIKLEPAFLTANEDVLFSDGYTRFRGRGAQGYNRYNGQRGYGSGNSNWRGYRGRRSYTGGYNRGFSERRGDGNEKKSSKSTNPIGSDGNIMLCNSCGSYRH